MAEDIQPAAHGIICKPCFLAGHTCPAYQVVDKTPMCVACLDGERCDYSKKHGGAKAEKPMPTTRSDSGKKLCGDGCGQELKKPSDLARGFIWGHKMPVRNSTPKQKASGQSHAEMTVSNVIAKVDAEIAELQRVKELLMKYAGV